MKVDELNHQIISPIEQGFQQIGGIKTEIGAPTTTVVREKGHDQIPVNEVDLRAIVGGSSSCPG